MPHTQSHIKEIAYSAMKVPVAKRIGALRKESEETRRDRALARDVREKTTLYKNRIMKL